MSLLERPPYDGAIADIDLGGGQALPLIEWLETRKIPFVPITRLIRADIVQYSDAFNTTT